LGEEHEVNSLKRTTFTPNKARNPPDVDGKGDLTNRLIENQIDNEPTTNFFYRVANVPDNEFSFGSGRQAMKVTPIEDIYKYKQLLEKEGDTMEHEEKCKIERYLWRAIGMREHNH
jgi:hypothetical protein